MCASGVKKFKHFENFVYMQNGRSQVLIVLHLRVLMTRNFDNYLPFPRK